jgi:hypothetical protein
VGLLVDWAIRVEEAVSTSLGLPELRDRVTRLEERMEGVATSAELQNAVNTIDQVVKAAAAGINGDLDRIEQQLAQGRADVDFSSLRATADALAALDAERPEDTINPEVLAPGTVAGPDGEPVPVEEAPADGGLGVDPSQPQA